MTLNNIITILLSAGFLTFLGTLIKVILEHLRGTKGQELDAEDRLITRLEKRIEVLDKHVLLLEGARDADREYIGLLLAHISDQKPPPPPARR